MADGFAEGSHQTDEGAECFICESPVDVQEDEWWQHRWEENPSEENVEKAIEEMEFRDWFVENKIVCKDCHKELIDHIEKMRIEA